MPMALTLYGIRNCDTVKKARAWLDSHGVEYRFHDYKVNGVEQQLLEDWCREIGWESVLNRKGTTYRKLDPALTQNLNAKAAIALMLAHPSAIRRPLVTGAGPLMIGFDPDEYELRHRGKPG
jgi:arsenate reductase